MTRAIQHRCFNHPGREAAARCLECRNSFCRECVTEHGKRLICASCLKKLAARAERPKRNYWGWVAPLAGFLFAWMCLYLAGWFLSSIPNGMWGQL